MGQAMAQMAQAEDKASAGEIFIDAQTYRAVADQVLTDETRDGFRRLTGVREGSADPDQRCRDLAGHSVSPAGGRGCARRGLQTRCSASRLWSCSYRRV